MLLKEILRMAFASLGVNKLRSFLTMSGITIGVFSVIGVMTTVSAIRGSIEQGLSFLGSNMFQMAKYPNGPLGDGATRRRIEARRNLTFAEAHWVAAVIASNEGASLMGISVMKVVQGAFIASGNAPRCSAIVSP